MKKDTQNLLLLAGAAGAAAAYFWWKGRDEINPSITVGEPTIEEKERIAQRWLEASGHSVRTAGWGGGPTDYGRKVANSLSGLTTRPGGLY